MRPDFSKIDYQPAAAEGGAGRTGAKARRSGRRRSASR